MDIQIHYENCCLLAKQAIAKKLRFGKMLLTTRGPEDQARFTKALKEVKQLMNGHRVPQTDYGK